MQRTTRAGPYLELRRMKDIESRYREVAVTMTPNKETYYYGIVDLSLHEYCTVQFLPCKILSVNFLIAVYFSPPGLCL